MKQIFGKRNAMLSASALAVAILFATVTGSFKHKPGICTIQSCTNPEYSHICVMKTIFGLENEALPVDPASFTGSEAVEASLKKGLSWLKNAQNKDGGWGAGSHYKQNVMDPHAVSSDPATTALVAMSLLRTENTLDKGAYSDNLNRANQYLMKIVEECPINQRYLTQLSNTQPQTKLGRNIDVILTAQFFTNLLRSDIKDKQLKKRIEQNLDKCIAKIQDCQDVDGSWKDGGWAPVLQSALANNALETAKDIGRKVNDDVLDRSRKYQNSNFDIGTQSALTGKAAGVMLYSLSGTTRASAQDAKKARDIVEKAKAEGKLGNAAVTSENLVKAGISAPQAKELETAFQINEASRKQALRSDVLAGFGSNGGEEFISYLMTGESLIMQGGNEWKKWYDMMESKLVKIQNNDGSWNGHHCITSPVFCTATCVLILSIHKDMQFQMNLQKSTKGS
jgi:hypothetical protein